ncbi:MAG: DUF1937 family protein [Arhodomonas sp.]|nr:DUF1937 family protein [Arhodomonas sp.]
MDHLVYLLSPYSHTAPSVRMERFHAATRFTARAMAEGWNVFSPIVHSHAVSAYLDSDNATDHDFWLPRCRWHLDRCTHAWALRLSEWERSVGMTWELDRLRARGVHTQHFALDDYIPPGPFCAK